MLSVLFRGTAATVIISFKFSVSCLELFGHLAAFKTSEVRKEAEAPQAGRKPRDGFFPFSFFFFFLKVEAQPH